MWEVDIILRNSRLVYKNHKNNQYRPLTGNGKIRSNTDVHMISSPEHQFHLSLPGLLLEIRCQIQKNYLSKQTFSKRTNTVNKHTAKILISCMDRVAIQGFKSSLRYLHHKWCSSSVPGAPTWYFRRILFHIS